MKKILLRCVISFGFIGLLIYLMREDIPKIHHTLLNMNCPLAGAAALMFLSTIWVMARRLQLIFEAKQLSVSVAEASQLTLVGYFFNNFLPTSVGGDVVKALCAARVTKSAVKSVTGVLMDRMLGLFTFILIPSLTLLFFIKKINNPLVPFMVYSFLALSAVFSFMLFSRSVARYFKFIETLLHRIGIGQKAREIYDNLHDFKNHGRTIVGAMALSVVGQSISFVVLYAMSLALGAHAGLIYFFLLVPVVQLVSLLPSLNGLGIREGAYIYFLGPYIGKEYAAALGILWLGLLFLLSIVGGIVYLFRQDYHIRFKQAAMPTEEGVQ